jgi:hypothetical protein
MSSTLVKGYVISPQVLLGLLSVWNVSFLGYPARVRNYIIVLFLVMNI